MSKWITERPFYRSQILGNAEVLFPGHNAKLITIKDPSNKKRKTLLISSKTGKVLLEEANGGEGAFRGIYGQTEHLLFEKVAGHVEGLNKEKVETQGMRDDVEVLEAKLAEETERREALELRVAFLEQQCQRRDEIEKHPALLELKRGQGTESPVAFCGSQTGQGDWESL